MTSTGPSSSLVVAAVQPRCVPGDAVANAAAHAGAVRAARARVVAFPEMSLTGYVFDAPAVAEDDPVLEPIVAACAETGSLALVGAPVEAGGERSIGVLAVDGDGARVAYRKMFLGGAEPGHFTPGTAPGVVEVGGWRLGLAICKDTGVPEHAARTCAVGVDAYVAGALEFPEDAAVPEERARRIAAEHGVWVVIASFAGPAGGDYVAAPGGSGLWRPGGAVEARAGAEPGGVARAALTPRGDRDDAVVAAARAGDEAAFARLVERHRRELRAHCYRMVGSVDEAEDLVQETFLRAWRHIGGFEGRSTLRAWLYRIATNACLDALDGRARRVLPQDLEPATTEPGSGPTAAAMVARADVSWLQPLPDHLWEPAADRDEEPEAVAVRRETIELAFIAALQHLPPRRRAVLVLRDVLGWPARQTAEHLGVSEASVTSALHRARTTLRERLPERRADWAPTTEPTAAERAVVDRYMAAVERADLAAVADLLAEDVRAAMPPWSLWLAGRPAVMAALTTSWDPRSPDYVGQFRMVATRANGQPAVATYLRAPGDDAHRAFAIGALRIEGGRIAEIVAFHDPTLFPAFGLPATAPASPPG
jgi:RNA polymerase sigma-70 factor (ECF subfamily)